MSERAKKLLFDILNCIAETEGFTKSTPNFDVYSKDRATQLIVERLLSIIGEATVRLRGLEQPILLNNGQQIIGFRNRLIHAYDSLDNAMVYIIFKKHLPKLRAEIEVLLEEN